MSTAEEPKTSGLLQPGQIIRPMVKTDEVPALVSRLFGLAVTSVKELNSYDDKNFYIEVESTIKNPHITDVCPQGYVLKILNSMDTKNESLVDGQNQMMLFLHSKGFNVPKPERNIHGTYMVAEKLKIMVDDFVANNVTEEPSREYMVRLLTFLSGKILHQVEYTPQLFYECGVFVAKMDNALKDFQNEALRSRKSIWSLESVPELAKFAFAVRDEGHHKMILEILDAWHTNVIPLMPKLQKGMIHGDFNEQNIIVKEDPENQGTFHVDGVIDFGDVHHSCYLFEVAITIMYMMVEVKVMTPNDAGGHVLAGYLQERKLEECEWDILKECVAGRFAQSLVMGAYSYEQDPGNEYLLVTAVRGWSVLAEFWMMPKDQIVGRWKEIVSSYER